MAKYQVSFKTNEYFTIRVEADSEESAINTAYEELSGISEEWELDDVEKLD
jgi:hypothetical protein